MSTEDLDLDMSGHGRERDKRRLHAKRSRLSGVNSSSTGSMTGVV